MFTRNLIGAIQTAHGTAFVAVLVVFLYIVPILVPVSVPVSPRSVHAALLTTSP